MPSGRPLYVMHIAETLKGGIASYLQDLCAALSEQDASLRQAICAPSTHLEELGRDTTATHISLGKGGRSIAGLFGLAWALVGILRRERPDVLHVHSTFAGVLVRLLRILRLTGNAAIVYCPHGWAFDRESGTSTRRVIALIERALAPFTDAIINISHHEQRIAAEHGIRPLRMVVCENAIRLPEPAARPSTTTGGPLRVLFVGRFDRQKGIDIAAEIIKQLKNHRPVEFIVVGAPVLDEGLEVAFPEGTRQLGWVPRRELFDIFRDCDIVLMPSRWEGFGLVAIEAMSVGTPVFAARVGGLTDIIEHEIDGWLFDPSRTDSAVSLLSKLDRKELEAAGAAAQKKVRERFYSKRLAHDVLRVYLSLPGTTKSNN